MKTKETGNRGESLACDYLQRQGYTILGRNVYIGHEELDIICENEQYTVFVEVKTRTFFSGGVSPYGRPAAAVNYTKRKHVAAAAAQYLREHPLFQRFPRIDVIEVLLFPYEAEGETLVAAEINHIKGAFGAGGRL